MCKQLLINRLTIKDFLINIFLYIRFFIYSRINLTKRISDKNKPDYDLTFIEEFDTVTWDYDGSTKWKIGESFGLYHPDKDNVYYGEPDIIKIGKKSYGKFKVEYKPKKFGEIEIPFAVSLLSSEKSFYQQYGRFECRMNLPMDRGAWPAFWLWGPSWPPEIDIIEAYGKKNGNSIKTQKVNLWWNKDNEPDCIGGKQISLPDADFHEFALEWRPGYMKFYTDGVLVFQYTNKKILNEFYNKNGTNMWIIINHSIQEQYVKRDEQDYYSEFLVDYIRVYTKNKFKKSRLYFCL